MFCTPGKYWDTYSSQAEVNADSSISPSTKRVSTRSIDAVTASVGTGAGVGAFVGTAVGVAVGTGVGGTGDKVGIDVGASVGQFDSVKKAVTI